MASNYGLLWLLYGLRWGIVACCFGPLGFSGRHEHPPRASREKMGQLALMDPKGSTRPYLGAQFFFLWDAR